MPYCAYCGKQLQEGAKFCASCGKPTTLAGAAGAPAAAPPPPVGAPSPSQPGFPPPPPPPPSAFQSSPYTTPGTPWTPARPKRRSLGWLWAVLSCVVVVAIACVLVFVVFHDNIFGGGGASSPEKAVMGMFKAMEDKDLDAILDLLDPDIMKGELGDLMGEDLRAALRQEIKDQLFSQGSVKFSGVKFKTEKDAEDSATVTVVEGAVTLKSNDGTEVTEDVQDAGEPVTFHTVKRDGSWYIDPMSLDW